MQLNNCFSPQGHICTISVSTSIRHRTWRLWTKTVSLVRFYSAVKNMVKSLVSNITIKTAGRCAWPLNLVSFFVSFADPYAHVSFLHVSKTTEKLQATLNPTWDQTLIFNDVEIYGDPKNIAQCPPDVVLEFFDNDQVVSCGRYT